MLSNWIARFSLSQSFIRISNGSQIELGLFPAEMEANLLFAGSNQISEDRMYGVYRKEPNQVEKYCITAVSEITELRKRNPESSICLLLDTKYKGQILSLRFIRFGKK
jgi:hypothetical protein